MKKPLQVVTPEEADAEFRRKNALRTPNERVERYRLSEIPSSLPINEDLAALVATLNSLSIEFEFAGQNVFFLSKEDYRQTKQAAGRPKDIADLALLDSVEEI